MAKKKQETKGPRMQDLNNIGELHSIVDRPGCALQIGVTGSRHLLLIADRDGGRTWDISKELYNLLKKELK